MNNSQTTNYKLGDDPIIRFCAFYILLYLGSFILGGVGIFLIVFGLTFFFTRVLARTPSGQMFIRRFFYFKEPEQIVAETHSRLYKTITTSVRLISFGLYTYGSIVLIWFGVKFLLNDGFLNQNLIYLFFFKFR
jgi:hypothetical protein